MIGIFDSGSGGLTVLRAIRNEFPSVEVLYFGDIKNVPYGSKTREELSLLTVRAMQFLQERGADSIVSACNSVSASLAISLFDTLAIEPKSLIEMVGPTVSYFKDSPGRLALVATPATIRSEIYQSAFRMVGKDVECHAIEGLAERVEFGAPESEITSIIHEACAAINREKCDTVILACTHYPLVQTIFERVLGETTTVFDPAVAVAERVQRRWWPREVGSGKTHFAITQDSEHFRTLIRRLFLMMRYSVEVI